MIYHSAIFYPEDREELHVLAEAEKGEAEGRAFILPAMMLSRCASLYRSVFRRIPDGQEITAVIPIRREVTAEDGDSLFFQPPAGVEEFFTGDIRILDSGLPVSTAYGKEEYGQELLYPFISINNPHSALRIIYASAVSSEDVRKLASLLGNFPESTFIISANMTARTDDPEKDTLEMIGHLENGDRLLDLWRKGRISSPGVPAIEAVSRIVPGSWRLIGRTEGDRAAGHAALMRL